MGAKDSSKTRVVPVFSCLRERDATGAHWLRRLLSLPWRPGISGAPALISRPGEIARFEFEARIDPPVSLLRWLIDNRVDNPPTDFGSTSSSVREKRSRLFAGDLEIREEALGALSRGRYRQGDWYVFEGPTSVDAYIETRDLIILIEGKRTEAGPTTSTTWMKPREQMLRNIDPVWDGRGNRQVVAFYIVGADASPRLPSAWERAVRATVSDTTLRKSLPHRTASERAEMARGFLGATSWGRVCVEFGIDYDALPDVL